MCGLLLISGVTNDDNILCGYDPLAKSINSGDGGSTVYHR
jgi:hypothetical protein